MKLFVLLFLMVAIPGAAFGLEQSFTRQGLTATIKLSPEKLETQSEVQLSLGLSKDGTGLTDRDVTLEIYEKNVDQPIIKRPVDLLDTEYVDSWKFEKAGDYILTIKITDHRNPDETIQYEVNASVMDSGGEHENHGFFAHHFSGKGKWGWWGTGLMIIIMVPMMALML